LYNVSCSWHKIAVPVKSLQIKSKYQVLTPIIRKITTARNERKKQEHRISSLQQELKEARNSLAQSHQRFSTLVRELVDKKEKIDKRLVKKSKCWRFFINIFECQLDLPWSVSRGSDPASPT
jgi:septal ring factor EnvC (AmiA/AmiB activator)